MDTKTIVFHDAATEAEATTSLALPDFVSVRSLYLSPDGSRVAALVQFRGSGFDGCRMLVGPTDGTELTSVLPPDQALSCSVGNTDVEVASPDRKWLMLFNLSGTQQSFYALNLLTGTATRVLTGQGSLFADTTFSFPPAGTTGVAVQRDITGAGPADVTLVHAGGSPPTPVSPPAGYEFRVSGRAWSPSGDRVALGVVANGVHSAAPIDAAIIDASTGETLSVVRDAPTGENLEPRHLDGACRRLAQPSGAL